MGSMRQIQDLMRYGYCYYKCPDCGAEIKGEGDAGSLYCPCCEKVVKVGRAI